MIRQARHTSPAALVINRAFGTPGHGRTYTPAIAAIISVSFSVLTATRLWSSSIPSSVVPIAHFITFAVLCLLIVARPVWGIIIIGASFPVAGILPPVGFTTSAYPLLGAATLLGYGREFVFEKSQTPIVTLSHVLACILIAWITLSNPPAAFSIGDRVWLWTYVQLLALMFLTTQLMKHEHEHRALMATYVIGAIISAYVAVHQVQFGLSSAASLRARGLAEGANDAGRYYVLAVVFLAHLRHAYTKRWLKVLSIAAIVILLAGLAATVSRTSVLLLLLGIGLMLIERTKLLKERLFEFGLAIAAAALLVVPVEYWRIVSGIVVSIVQGQDSVGFRYMQWDAGLAMWADHPVAGVGIGQFENHSVYYGTNFIPFYGLRWSAHNTYVTMLAETGLVGFLLFLALIIAAAIGLKNGWVREQRGSISATHYTWLTALTIMLIGGMTGDDHVHKFIWLIFGLGAVHLTPLFRSRSI